MPTESCAEYFDHFVKYATVVVPDTNIPWVVSLSEFKFSENVTFVLKSFTI